VTSRTYLSIGDVLTLLREEFPDVTISKIRFLESQGLVNPERSPSGYRKFYDHDVERLRWVLRQQREHFLPLKVIRDRLASEGDAALASPVPADAPFSDDRPAVVGGHDAEAAGQHTNGSPAHSEEPALALSGSVQRPPSASHQAATAGSSAPSFDRPSAAARPPAAPAPAAPAAVAAAAAPPPTGGLAPSASGPGHAAQSASSQASSSQPPSGQAQAGQPPSGQSPSGQPPVPPARPQPAAAAPPPAQPEPPAAPAVPVAAPPPPTTPPPAGLTAGLSGASLTAQELASATGLAETTIASLEGFGLIEPMVVAGAQYYDEEALTVAKLVADFAQYGIEPRHLRLYRNAVDREGGLIEQVVTPLLRQRNPEARQRAVDAAVDLSKLGQGLRASLLRRELRRQVGS
jgi:DNA-binding transcriptional MerR regulator